MQKTGRFNSDADGQPSTRDRSVGERKICGMCLVGARSSRAVRLTVTLWLAQPTRRCRYGPRLIAPHMTSSLSWEEESPFPGDSLNPWVVGSNPARPTTCRFLWVEGQGPDSDPVIVKHDDRAGQQVALDRPHVRGQQRCDPRLPDAGPDRGTAAPMAQWRSTGRVTRRSRYRLRRGCGPARPRTPRRSRPAQLPVRHHEHGECRDRTPRDGREPRRLVLVEQQPPAGWRRGSSQS